MTLAILGALVLFVTVTASFIKRLRRTTLWAGRVISDPLVLSQMPRGMQDAITPPALTFITIAIFAARLSILGVGTFFVAWYAGILTLLLSIILSELVGLLFPKTLLFYIHILLRDMHRRYADYTRDGDIQRALASQHMISGLTWLITSTHVSRLPIPTTLQAMKATKDDLEHAEQDAAANP